MTSNHTNGLKRACTNCRQQKIRCMVAENSSICSKCQRMKLSCHFDLAQKRSRKRTHEELEPAQSLTRLLAPNPVYTATPGLSIPISLPSIVSSEPLATSRIESPFLAAQTTSETPLSLPATTSSLLSNLHFQGSLPRTLEGLQIGSSTVEDLFTIYFSKYAPFLPIFPSDISPNLYYDEAPLVFWAILTVASRRYRKDFTLLAALSSRVMRLALLSVNAKPSGLPVIKGLLILLTWAIPETETSDEMAYVLCGATIHLALKLGLHVPLASQDFARVKLELTEQAIMRRAELWAHCVILYQRSSCKAGIAFGQISGLAGFHRKLRGQTDIPEKAHFHLQLQDLVAKANMALMEHGLELESPDEERAVDLILRIYTVQLKALEFGEKELLPLDKVYSSIAMLQLLGIHLFKDAARLELKDLTQLYVVTCSTIEIILETDKTYQHAMYGTTYIWMGLLLATGVLLRILKTPLKDLIPHEGGESIFLAGLGNLRKWSMANNDQTLRITQSIGNLWRSDKVFKFPDGSYNLSLRIRSRLAMSICFDIFWWYREQAMDQGGAYSHQSRSATSPQSALHPSPAIASDDSLIDPMAFSSEFAVDDFFLLSDPIMFEPGTWDPTATTGPYSSNRVPLWF